MNCRKKHKIPPILPPAETMLIDFSNFILTSGATVNIFNVKGTDDANWRTAAEITSPWRTLTDVMLSVPITAYKTVAGYNASNVSGNKWEWRCNTNISGATYKVRLIGETSGSQVKWEMYVSRDGTDGFTEFKWLDGTSNIAGTKGQWTLYEDHTAQTTALLQIDWKRSGTKIEKVKYTYVKDGQSKNAYIEFGPASGGYDFYYTVHYYNTTLGKFSDVNIEWNHTSKVGRIQSSDYLDGTWKCWDAQKINVACN